MGIVPNPAANARANANRGKFVHSKRHPLDDKPGDHTDRMALLLAVRNATTEAECVIASRKLWQTYRCTLPKCLERFQIHQDIVTLAGTREAEVGSEQEAWSGRAFPGLK